LFLIPLDRVNGNPQMIFVLGEHTPFAAGAKRRDRTGKFIKFQKKSPVGRGPSVRGQRSCRGRRARQLQNGGAHSPTCAASLRKAHACNLGSANAQLVNVLEKCGRTSKGGNVPEQEAASHLLD
jgi:hypothetical protein